MATTTDKTPFDSLKRDIGPGDDGLILAAIDLMRDCAHLLVHPIKSRTNDGPLKHGGRRLIDAESATIIVKRDGGRLTATVTSPAPPPC